MNNTITRNTMNTDIGAYKIGKTLKGTTTVQIIEGTVQSYNNIAAFSRGYHKVLHPG